MTAHSPFHSFIALSRKSRCFVLIVWILCFSALYWYFYPRSPRGERHVRCVLAPRCAHISIHAPREGSDSCRPRDSRRLQHFYPRSPRGERRLYACSFANSRQFLSTLPARGATTTNAQWHREQTDFYPRSPRGERPSSKSP